MKITAIQYAKTLYELTEGKSQKEIDVIVANFIKLLNQKRQLKLAPKVVAKFSEIYNQENGIVEAEVISREKLDKDVLTRVSTYVRTKYKAKEVVLYNKIDSNIKGGIVIKVGDEIMDGSVQSQLNNLRNILIK